MIDLTTLDMDSPTVRYTVMMSSLQGMLSALLPIMLVGPVSVALQSDGPDKLQFVVAPTNVPPMSYTIPYNTLRKAIEEIGPGAFGQRIASGFLRKTHKLENAFSFIKDFE